MTFDKLNELFCSKDMEYVLFDIAKQNDLRMCLNLDVMNEYKLFFGKIITLSFVVDILSNELIEIYKDVEKYICKKLCLKLKINNIENHKKKIEKYLNEILGNKQVLFHGTTSAMETKFLNNHDNNYLVLQPCRIIDDIYRKHNIYKAFESGIQDFENKSFWVTTNPFSASFYSLQSPEYFARFASRSDYYKQDIFNYDRIAYYRKDFKFCLKNIKREIKEFNFNNQEKKIVLKNFTKMWEKIVCKDLKNLIFYKEIETKNIHHFDKNDKVFDLVLKYFTKVHFKYDFNDFKINLRKIILPDVKKYLKRHYPIINKKFVILNNKKFVPDFYSLNKYVPIKYVTFKKKQPILFKRIEARSVENDFLNLIELINEAKPNTYQAKKFFKQKLLPKASDIIKYYKDVFEKKINELESESSMSAKIPIIKEICENIDLKYIISLKYNKYFKDVSLYNIYQYRKYLGIKLFEHYDGVITITSEKINTLTRLYKKILQDDKFVVDNDIPLKIYNGELALVK